MWRPCLIFISTEKCCSEIVPHFNFFPLSPWVFERKLFKGSWNGLVCFGRIGIISFKIRPSATDISRSRRARKKKSMLVKFRTVIVMEAQITVAVIETKTKKTKQTKNLERDSNWTRDLNLTHTTRELHAPPWHRRHYVRAMLILP